MYRRTLQTLVRCHWHPALWWTPALEWSDEDYLKHINVNLSLCSREQHFNKFQPMVISNEEKTMLKPTENHIERSITYFSGHHRDVVPSGHFSVQRFQCCDRAIVGINAKQPFKICVSVNGVSTGEAHIVTAVFLWVHHKSTSVAFKDLHEYVLLHFCGLGIIIKHKNKNLLLKVHPLLYKKRYLKLSLAKQWHVFHWVYSFVTVTSRVGWKFEYATQHTMWHGPTVHISGTGTGGRHMFPTAAMSCVNRYSKLNYLTLGKATEGLHNSGK